MIFITAQNTHSSTVQLASEQSLYVIYTTRHFDDESLKASTALILTTKPTRPKETNYTRKASFVLAPTTTATFLAD